MDAAKLYQLIENPSLFSSETLTELKQVTEKYPYFQTARILYLKNLSVLKDINFAFELKKMAVYISDRKNLFTLIEGEKYGLEPEIEKELAESTGKDSFRLIDSFLSSRAEELEGTDQSTILFHPSLSSDYIHWAVAKDPIKTTEKEVAPKLQHQDLIDSFIKEDEQRTPGRGFTLPEEVEGYSDDLPEESVEQSLEQSNNKSEASGGDSYFTETLAQIYIKQRRYDKALEIIKSLSLKYPEKNVYFADQIRFLEKLIINTKK